MQERFILLEGVPTWALGAAQGCLQSAVGAIAMMGTKLNAQVIIKNLQNMHEKSLPRRPAHGSAKEDGLLCCALALSVVTFMAAPVRVPAL